MNTSNAESGQGLTACEREEVALASVLSVLRRWLPSSSSVWSTARGLHRTHSMQVRHSSLVAAAHCTAHECGLLDCRRVTSKTPVYGIT